MRYISTRGRAPVLEFDDVLLSGLARDGGLYVPRICPRFSKAYIRSFRGLSYAEIAVRVMYPFLGGSMTEAAFADLAEDAYAQFDHPAVAPMRQLGSDHWVMELFHGPTLSFKDYALQLVGRLFDHVLTKRGQKVTIVGATSGDTGSAAIEACRDRESIEIFILHPQGRVSDVQRRQMTTVTSSNVHNIALEGHFDDCQDLVKAMFNDIAFRDRHALSAVNSINWARIMAQVAYYFVAGIRVGAPYRSLDFAVPTGNFGNVYSGYVARKMGLPIKRFIVGSNTNDILTRFFDTGTMRMEKVVPTLSPSMDIQVSSNFERLLFDYSGRNGKRLTAVMEDFRRSGEFSLPKTKWRRMRRLFSAYRLDDAATKAAIRRFYEATGELLDPHSVIGAEAGKVLHEGPGPALISLATAHPAKFPDAVEDATGARPGLPPRLSDLFERPERFEVLPNDAERVKDFIASRLKERTA